MKTTYDHNEINKGIKSLAKRYRSDSAFRAKVDADPAAALRSEGCADIVPKGFEVNLHLNDAKTLHVVFPPAPSVFKGAMGDEALDEVAGGICGRHSQHSYRPPSHWYPQGCRGNSTCSTA
ncbi:MAG: hypothetical protein OXU44_01575 [Gammaproteobacteria bacterium]|nr:hypothetical protein [Gammaproteobacteria bacterium]MDD9806989.1 hypothetical protein [Gammaproteobacteria bacterium]